MGCCVSKETGDKYPRASEEHVTLSSQPDAPSAFSGGRLLVDTNLDASSPDTHRPPPAPLPINLTLGATQATPVTQEICCDKNNTSLLSANSNSVQETPADNHGTSPKSEELKELGATQTAPVTQEICGDKNNTSSLSTNSNSVQEPSGNNHGTSPKSEELKESECKGHADLEQDSAKDSEIELPKLEEPINLVEEEDECPICLEEYDAENPKLTIKCGHDFHLACILEWMERSATCPFCDQATVFSTPIE